MAYYNNEKAEDLEKGKIITGSWYLTCSYDICNNGEAEVLFGPLMSPIKYSLTAIHNHL